MMNNMFGNLQFGVAKGYKMSHLGIAVKNAAGAIVSYDRLNKAIVDVDIVDFKADNMVYHMPAAIKDVVVGDVILHNGKPVFVTEVSPKICAVDVSVGEEKIIMPTKSMFGFNFVTKVVCLLEMTTGSASEDSPFGNLLPLMMMQGGGSNSMMPMMMMMSQGGANPFGSMFDASNPMGMMMMMSMFDGGSESKDFFPMMMMMQSFQKTPVTTSTAQTEKNQI